LDLKENILNTQNLEFRKLDKLQIGIKSTEILMPNLKYFKFMDSNQPDIMHDILEGVLSTTFGCLMNKLESL
jgi:hypothetical protein